LSSEALRPRIALAPSCRVPIEGTKGSWFQISSGPRPEPDAGEVGGVPFRAGAGLGGIGRVGRDRPEPQRGEQPVERAAAVGVDMGEDAVEVDIEISRAAQPGGWSATGE
jgi:hypothetical protein